MENEDRIAAGLRQLHEDLEKLTAAVEKNYTSSLAHANRWWRRNIGVYLAVVAAFVLWSLLTYHRW